MEYIVSVVWGILDIIFIMYFCNAYLPHKQKNSAFFLATVLTSILCVAFRLFNLPRQIESIASLAFVIIMVQWLYKGPWYQLILFVMVGYIIGVFFNTVTFYAVSVVTGISYSDLVWKKLLYFSAGLTGKLLSLLFAWLCKQVRKPKVFYEIQRKWLLLSILFSTVSLFMIFAVFFTSRTSYDLSIQALLFSGIIALADVAMLYLIDVMEKSTIETQKLSLLHQQMEIQAKSIQALEKSYKTQRQLTHDFKNQLQTISALLINGQTEEAIAYVDQLQDAHSNRILVVNSNHPIIDAVLNMKYHAAQANNIDFHFTVSNLSSIAVDTNVLVVLLSNLLDNAIEACCRIPAPRVIHCEILAEPQLYIAIRNTSCPVLIKNNHIETSKEPKEEHGFGLQQIQYLLEQLHAEYIFGYDRGWFSFVTEIPS